MIYYYNHVASSLSLVVANASKWLAMIMLLTILNNLKQKDFSNIAG